MSRDDEKYERVEILMLPSEKSDLIDAAKATFGSACHLSAFVRAAVKDKIEALKKDVSEKSSIVSYASSK